MAQATLSTEITIDITKYGLPYQQINLMPLRCCIIVVAAAAASTLAVII